MGALFCGVCIGLGVRRISDIFLVTCSGILVGHVWAERYAADIALPFWLALQETTHGLKRYHLVLAALVVAGGVLGRYAAARMERGRGITESAVEQ